MLGLVRSARFADNRVVRALVLGTLHENKSEWARNRNRRMTSTKRDSTAPAVWLVYRSKHWERTM